MASCDFDTLFTKTRTHILEKICLSLDYGSFKNCLEVSKTWNGVLTSKVFQKKAKCVFHEEIREDGKRLLAASEDGDSDVVRKLLAVGMVDADTADKNGVTSVFKAAENDHKDVVQILIDGGADPNKAANCGYTPLMVAAGFVGSTDVVQVLLDGGAKPNNADIAGRNALYMKLYSLTAKMMWSHSSWIMGQTLIIRDWELDGLLYILLYTRKTKMWSNSSLIEGPIPKC